MSDLELARRIAELEKTVAFLAHIIISMHEQNSFYLTEKENAALDVAAKGDQ